jgi:hypothetical protein
LIVLGKRIRERRLWTVPNIVHCGSTAIHIPNLIPRIPGGVKRKIRT